MPAEAGSPSMFSNCTQATEAIVEMANVPEFVVPSPSRGAMIRVTCPRQMRFSRRRSVSPPRSAPALHASYCTASTTGRTRGRKLRGGGEIERRAREVLEGKVALEDGDAVHAAIRERLRAQQERHSG